MHVCALSHFLTDQRTQCQGISSVHMTPANRSVADKVISVLCATLSSPHRIISVFLSQNTWHVAAVTAVEVAEVVILVGHGVWFCCAR